MSSMKKKREYSRNGCLECKKRKLKCDEFKPSCWHCFRLHKTCNYQRNIRFTDSRTFTFSNPSSTTKLKIVSSNNGQTSQQQYYLNQESNYNEPIPYKAPLISLADNTEIESDQGGNNDSNGTSWRFGLPIQVHETNTIGGETEEGGVLGDNVENRSSIQLSSSNNTPTLQSPHITPPLSTNTPPQENDLLRYVNSPGISDWISSPEPTEHPGSDVPESDLPTERLSLETASPTMTLTSIPRMPAHTPYSLTPRELGYLEVFYHRNSYYILPFGPRNSNPYRDSIIPLALHNKFLFSAVMAASARTSFRFTNDPFHDAACCHYMAQAMSSLSTVLAADRLLDDGTIEPVIQTVLILCTDHTSARGFGWRAHLRGAKELLYRLPSRRTSADLALCKVWFAALEIIASITSPLGGTISDIGKDAFSDIGIEYLKKAGLIKPNGFNVFLGYSTDCLYIFAELADLLHDARAKRPIHNRKIEKLISDIITAKQVEFVEDSEEPSSSTSLSDTQWFAISHRAHCEAAILEVYSSLLRLPADSDVIRCSEETLITLLEQIPYSQPKAIMIHWPLLTAGFHAESIEHRQFVLDRLDLLMKSGVWSAEFTISRLLTKWRGTEDEYDAVPF